MSSCISSFQPRDLALTAGASMLPEKASSVGGLFPRSSLSFTKTILPESNLCDVLNSSSNSLISYVVSLSVLEDALINFLSSEFKSFDALIGNNSCYIVSYIIFSAATRMESDQTLREGIQADIEQIREIKRAIEKKTNGLGNLVSSSTILDFVKENAVDLLLDAERVYIAMAYACAISKEKNEHEYEEMQAQKLVDIYTQKLNLKIPKKAVQKLIKHWQKSLSVSNVQILRSEAEKSVCNTNLWAKYLIDQQYILKDSRERFCAPSLYSVAVIYDRLSRIPGALIALQVNLVLAPKNYLSRFTLFYEVQSDSSLSIVKSDDLAASRVVYVFAGCRYIPDKGQSVNPEEIKAEFLDKSLREIVLAHEVTYPQYPKALKAQNIVPTEPELREEIIRLQKIKGYSLDNPSELCLVHIFADNVLNQSIPRSDFPVYLPQLNNC